MPKGKSWLGGGKDKLGDQEVEIPADFYLGKYEVTQEEWQKVMGENPSYFSRTGDGKDAVKDIPDAELKRFPVENVSWDQCQLLCGEAEQNGEGDRLGLSVAEDGGMGVRVPGRADVGQEGQRLRLLLRQADEHPVGGAGEHRQGIQSAGQGGFLRAESPGIIRHGRKRRRVVRRRREVEGAKRYLRGGCYLDDPRTCRAQLISTRQSSLKGDTVGLRLARVPSGAPSPEVKTPSQHPDRRAPE